MIRTFSAISIKLTMAFILMTLISCKKEVVEKPTVYSIEGYWEGTYTSDNTPQDGESFFGMVVKPNGSILVETVQDRYNHNIHAGTWQLNGTTLTTVADFEIPGISTYHQVCTLTFSNSEGTLTGTWVNVPAASGKIKLKKVPNRTTEF